MPPYHLRRALGRPIDIVESGRDAPPDAPACEDHEPPLPEYMNRYASVGLSLSSDTV